ncbi:MAG: universal stress protein [Muribaculaceae bacterium]|nr:universal stress protein [Muribaculaceae bacterium]
MPDKGKLITLAIHTYEQALLLKALLEKNGITSTIHNVNLVKPVISSGVRVRIYEEDLPLALKIIEGEPDKVDIESIKHAEINAPKILIPIDFSDYSLKACSVGFDFANKLGGKVILLHSYISTNYSGSLPFNSDGYSSEIINIEDDEELDKAIHAKMNSFATKIRESIANKSLKKAEFSTVIAEGVPEDAILEYAKQIRSHLIIMGTRGKDKKEIDLIGSVTAEVLDAGKFPVFTVPENISLNNISDIKRVVFFSNLYQEDLISLDIFIRLFCDNKLDVTLIPILEKKITNIEQRNEAVLDYCNLHYPNFTFSIKTFADTKFLNDFEKYTINNNIDLIIIPNKKRNIFARLFNPSMAHRMLFHGDIPMLVVPV